MLELRSTDDVIRARLAARDLVRAAGLGVLDQTRLATAVSELARNAVRYGVEGYCELSDLSDARHVRLQALVRDSGPGIADIALAMEDGYSTGGSLGAGLPGTRRLVDHFDIRSSPAGTCVTVQIVRLRRI
jgi:serine/threonine-protein kinase RsbT